ncbi:unnamed protein product [Polarella glacialis]|uniref:Uncharacterized protein n=1 Tax=Polarella glacialis TaxID=89957 RepID=A0A813FFU8_POLGL|nr:unnamed protein product [Polarella glacialis]CAE8718073.1 unnamed protein product [Polarella glacialis]
MKVYLAFLTLDAMTLSLPLGLAAQDPDLLKFTSAAGKELWPWRDSVLTAAEKFAGDGVATEPAPRRALVSGAAEAAGPGLQQITDGGTRRSALKASRGTALGGRIPARICFLTKARIAGHRPTRFWSWQVAGAMEALTDVKPEECKARLLLLLACGEQLCLDGGSMLLAQELVVEEIPPYGSFRPQEGAGSLAQPWSALLNPTWASIHLQRLQETESWMEKRQQLAGGAKPKAGASEDGATAEWRCEGESATSASCEGGCQEGGEVASLRPLFFDWFILICEFKSEKIWLPGFDSTLGYPGEGPGRGARLVDDLLSGSLSTGLMFERVFSLAHTRSSRLASFLRSVKQEAALHSFAAFPFRDEPRWSSEIPHVDHSGSSPSLEALFPMPVPFAKDFVSKHKSNTDHRRINLVALVLSWLCLGRPSSVPASYKVFAELEVCQIESVKLLDLGLGMWKDRVVGVAELGRSADKYTQTSSAMFKLEEQATALLARLRPYRPYFPPEFKRAKEGNADRAPFAVAVGETQICVDSSKGIVADRIKVTAAPTFECSKLISSVPHRIVDQPDPRDVLIDLAAAVLEPPLGAELLKLLSGLVKSNF